MSSQSSGPSEAPATLASTDAEHPETFVAQLDELKKSQEEQYILLSKKYKENKDKLKFQQQQELKEYYQRQSVLGSSNKVPSRHDYPPTQIPPPYYHGEPIPRKGDYSSITKGASMFDDLPTQAGGGGSGGGLNALVKERLRKKAIDNINKKTHFEHVDHKDPSMPPPRRIPDDYNRWVYERYEGSGGGGGGGPPEDDDEPGSFSLRKAESEPNLRGRNQLKLRTNRYKPHTDHHPLNPRHYSPNDTSSSTASASRHREAVSPPYRPPLEKVFHPGPRGVPLFQSPSLPNIYKTSRSQVHFPSSSSSMMGSSGSSSSEMKAPFDPGHPKYLEMLKLQYATNHRYLQHTMVEYGYDPKEIDTFHQKYLAEIDDSSMSDVERVKQLLESQNKLYLHLAERLSSPYSKSYSKGLNSIDSAPSLMSSRSHDSLHNIKLPRNDPYLVHPRGGPSSGSRFPMHSRDFPPSLPPDLHSKDHALTRRRLKEHLREKQDASSIKTSMDYHQHEDKIQEETAEDVANEERKRASRDEDAYHHRSSELHAATKAESTNNTSVFDSSRSNGLSSRFNGSDTKLYSSSSSLHTSNPRLMGSEPRLYSSTEARERETRERESRERERDRLHGSNPHLHGSNPHLHSSSSRLSGSNPNIHGPSSRHNGSNSYLYGSNPRLYSSASRLHSSNSSLHRSDSGSKMNSSDPRISTGSDPRLSGHFIEPNKSTKHMTGLVYDTIMLKHQCQCGGNFPLHPECAGRLQSIWARLQETGVANLCEKIRPRKATISELQTVHSEQHTLLFGGGASSRGSSNLRCFTKLPCGGTGVDDDTIWNETHTANAARMAAGCVIELAFKVASGDLKNGFAIVRPPGHHAETHQAKGFCYFNSVAIAAKLLCMKMAVERVMILDWDIHHGNGTQQMFYDDDRVLYVSMHRHDEGSFFPGTGKAEECGAGIGAGTNINIPFNGGLDPMYGDKEYLAAFRSIVLPVAKEYKPDIILVSAGFAAADGHSPHLGGYNVTAACFAYMTKQLMELRNGKLVLALEGGYDLQSLCDSSEQCIRALLGGATLELTEEALMTKPHDNAVKCLEKAVQIQGKYWPGVKRAASLVNSSQNSAKRLEKEENETVNALASLSVRVVQQNGKGAETSEKKEESPASRQEEPMAMDEN
ncbi:histone deacetylase 4-like [Clytia hemisphaerica]|uniref:histone deacetylase n=1 Tax=Clytia hemisphaerica TaxID=252671 RepID=A0A7M5WWX1_9CNID|eukprot:TCONS_00061628-protein